jgi:hypothetical protein
MATAGQADAPEYRLIAALFAGDADAALATFDGTPRLDAPRVGKVDSVDALRELATSWAGMFGVEPGAPVRPRFRTVEDDRAVSEVILPDAGPANVELPIAIMGELSGDRLRDARVYYYQKPVTGTDGRRGTPFERRPDERLGRAEDMPDINAAYFRAVSAWDLEAAMAVFGDDAYIEVGGATITGRERIRRLYEHFFGNEVRLLFSTLTDDATTLVLEWTSGGDGDRESGLAAYDRDESGRLGAIRMYDNFDPRVVEGLVGA